MAAMPDTESDHHRDDAADVVRLDLVAPLAAPASSSSSSCDATTATATARDEDEEDDGFTFAAVDDSIPRLQDAADVAFFPEARIGSPVYPVFGRPRRSLSLPKQQRQQQQQDEVEEEDSTAAGTATVRRRRMPLGRLLLEDRWSDSAPSASGQQQQPVDAAAEAELDDVPADYCLWSPGASPARRRKSGSTGSPVLLRWRRRRRVVDGYSDGKDRFAFTSTSSDRIGAGEGHGWMNRGNDADNSTTTSFFSCKQDLVDLVVSAVTCRRRCYLF